MTVSKPPAHPPRENPSGVAGIYGHPAALSNDDAQAAGEA
jgi:hypothetical protein